MQLKRVKKMSLQLTLKKINNLLLQIKECLKTGNFQLPLIKCSRQFDFDKKFMARRNPIPITFSKNSVSTVLRIVEILTIVRNLLTNNKFITKRNLYYQLVKYYEYYAGLDGDLLMICDSLKVERSNLNIIVSSKLQLFWFNCAKGTQQEVKVQLSYKKFVEQQLKNDRIDKQQIGQCNQSEVKPTFVQKQRITLIPHQIFKIPNCPKLQVNILYPLGLNFIQNKKINLLIMQKQSLFQILSQSLTFKPPSNNQNWFLINSKGYPDMTALQFVNQIIKLSKQSNIQFYYIGDYDVYGIDIMLNYAIGSESFEGLWSRMKWLCLFDELVEMETIKNKQFRKKFEMSQHRKQTVEDKKKTRQMLARSYFQVDKLKGTIQSNEQNDKFFIEKVTKWKEVVQGLLQKDYQCEVESYFKNWMHPFDVIELMIQQKLYV